MTLKEVKEDLREIRYYYEHKKMFDRAMATSMKTEVLKKVERYNAFMRTVPVAAITLVLAIWVGSNILPSVIGVLLVFPVIYEQSRAATEDLPRSIEEVMDEAGASYPYRFVNVYLPMVLPQLLSGISATFGMNLKAVITAETLAYSLHSIGLQIYYAKANFVFESPVLFAWVVAAVLIAVLIEALLKFLTNTIAARLSRSVTE